MHKSYSIINELWCSMSDRYLSIIFGYLILGLFWLSPYLFPAFASSTFSYPLTVLRLDVETQSTPSTQILSGTLNYLVTEVNNTSDQPLNFTYITQIIDQNGYTVSISFDKHNVTPSERNVGLSNIWTPENPGKYAIEAFCLSEIFDNPTILCEKHTIQVIVV